MKEKIYTIPVNEAFDADCECPFCVLAKKTDNDVLEYVLGPSYMEEDIREETDKVGFCKEHYYKMFYARNRLGVSLMLSTHIKKMNKKIESLLKEESQLRGKSGLFARKSESPFAEFTKELSHSCYACQRIEGRMNSYFDTFFHLWKTEEEFRNKVKNCKGFCLEHLSRIICDGRKKLSSNRFSELMEVITKIETENLSRIDSELDWFIKKFDYRFKDEPWGNSKDAPERAILKIASASMDDITQNSR